MATNSSNDYENIFNTKYLEYHKNKISGKDPHIASKCILALASAFASRIGFIFVEVGSIPVENVYSIVLYNLLEVSIAILSYGLLGNLIAFRCESASGWISFGKWEWDDVSSMMNNQDKALIGICGVLLATAQLSSFLVGRIHLVGGMLLTAICSGVFVPFLMHWTWHEDGWMTFAEVLEARVSLLDDAGILTLHIPSVIFGTTGALFLGRRILKLKQIDTLSFGTDAVVITLTGYLLIIFSYIIFVPVVHRTDNQNAALPIINAFLAVGTGIFTVTILQRIVFRDIHQHRRIIRSVQGGAAGLISVAAAMHHYLPSVTIIVSMILSVIFFFFAEVIHNTALEDPCSLISSNLICGFVGVMVCCLLVKNEGLHGTMKMKMKSVGIQLLWQLQCTCVVISISVIVALFMFLLLKISGILKNKFEVINHKRATVLRDALPKRGYLERLFRINTTADYLVPGYWKSYFGMNEAASLEKKANPEIVPLSDGDKLRTDITLQRDEMYDDKELNTTVNQVNSGKASTNSEINWQLYGSGDYNPYEQIKSVTNLRNSTETVS